MSSSFPRRHETRRTVAQNMEPNQRSQQVSSQGNVDMPNPTNDEMTRKQRAAAARARYRRITEDAPPSPSEPGPSEAYHETASPNTKFNPKSEAQRMKYHNMTPEKKREHNQRRTELGRRRRREEDEMIAKPPGELTEEDRAKIEQILARRKHRAEMAKRRYQNMSDEQKHAINRKKSAQIKRKRTSESAGFQEEPSSSQYSNYSDDDEQDDDYFEQ